MQDHFEIEATTSTSSMPDPQSEDAKASVHGIGRVFDALVEALPSSDENSQDELDGKSFELALKALGLWPRDLGEELVGEIFSALCLSSTAEVARTLSGSTQRTTLSKDDFIRGFSHVPYNLPDFPVPTHLLAWDPKPTKGARATFGISQELSIQIAEALAMTFCVNKTGIGAVKDFFLSGLLSIEELQAALPLIVPHSAIEEAASLIIDTSSAYLTDDEWQELVLDVRTPEACSGNGNSETAAHGHGLAEILAMSAEARMCLASVASGDEAPLDVESTEVKMPHTPPAAKKSNIDILSRPLINWSTAGLPAGDEANGPGGADAAAGQENTPKKSCASFQQTKAPTSQAMAWLNLGLHHECAGPFLADAFVRCCELYHLAQARPPPEDSSSG